MSWYLYIVECQNTNLYTGITTNLKRRIKEHNTDNKKGAKYTRGKRPVRLVYFEKHATQSDAAKREIEIKNWKRERKMKLVIGFSAAKLGS